MPRRCCVAYRQWADHRGRADRGRVVIRDVTRGRWNDEKHAPTSSLVQDGKRTDGTGRRRVTPVIPGHSRSTTVTRKQGLSRAANALSRYNGIGCKWVRFPPAPPLENGLVTVALRMSRGRRIPPCGHVTHADQGFRGRDARGALHPRPTTNRQVSAREHHGEGVKRALSTNPPGSNRRRPSQPVGTSRPARSGARLR